MRKLFSISELEESGSSFINVHINRDDVDNVSLKVLEHDKPNHVMSLTTIYNSNEVLLKYDFSSVDKVSAISEGMSYKCFVQMLSKLCNLLCNCQYWFLDATKFLFDKKHVFYNKQAKQLQLIYIPVVKLEQEFHLKDLLLYLIEKVDIEQGDKLKISLLQEMVKPNFNSFRLQKFLNQQLSVVEENITTRASEDAGVVIKGKPEKKRSFLEWLFKPESLTVNENIESYNDSRKTSKKYYFHLKKNDTQHKLDKKIDISFVENTYLIGRKSSSSERSLIKYNFKKNVEEVNYMHLKLERKNNDIYATDLDSDLGTYVNGSKLNSKERTQINIGDSIAFSPKIEYLLRAR